jgi:ABC-2 type transport system permease protein
VPGSAWAPLALVTALCAFSCTGLGLINAGLGLIVRETAVLSNIIFGLLLIFCGANVPLDELPGWMRTISNGLPFTHGIQAARRLADGETLGDVGGLVAAEATIGVVYVVAGYGLLRALEVLSRRNATLERA